jgi:hypothetical protein
MKYEMMPTWGIAEMMLISHRGDTHPGSGAALTKYPFFKPRATLNAMWTHRPFHGDFLIRRKGISGEGTSTEISGGSNEGVYPAAVALGATAIMMSAAQGANEDSARYCFDLWAERWRRQEARGDMVVVRYADDLVVGFEHEGDARRFLDAMRGQRSFGACATCHSLQPDRNMKGAEPRGVMGSEGRNAAELLALTRRR